MRKLVIFPADLLYGPGEGAAPDSEFSKFIEANSGKHWFVAVSNRGARPGFKEAFPKVVFQRCGSSNGGSRASGKIVGGLLDVNQVKLNLQKSQVVILGYGETDVPMYANSQSILIRCDWRPDIHSKILPYGIPCPTIADLPNILKLLNEENPWYFTAKDPLFDTYCLTNAATRVGSDEELKALAAKLQSCLKQGNLEKRDEFKVHLVSSIYATEIFATADIWSYYPSSGSSNDGGELIADFVEIARTTYKKRKKKNPLFIRHIKTGARHSASQKDRENPKSQIETIHLHPDYRGEIEGKTIVVLDDFMTHGISFSVAASLLKAAGAKKVLAVVIGKFPRTSYVTELEIHTDPFKPVSSYKIIRTSAVTGTNAPEASEAFKRKFE